MRIKINFTDIHALRDLGISAATIDKIHQAKDAGHVFRSKSDFAALDIPQPEIDLLSGNISYTEPAPGQDVTTVTITTEPRHLLEYTLQVRYTNRNTGEPVQDIYFIDYDGKTDVRYDNLLAAEPFVLVVKAPDGRVVETGGLGQKAALEHTFTKAAFKDISLHIHHDPEIQTAEGIVSRPARIRGKLIASNPAVKTENIQVVFSVAVSLNENGAPDFYPVCFAQTETDGYFFSSPLSFRAPGDYNKILRAKAQVAIAGSPEIPVRLQSDETGGDSGQLPERVILYLDELPATGDDAHDDCGCGGGCGDLNFHDKKVLEEFSYFTVVRTTEPLIRATEISDVEEVQLEDLVDGIVTDPKITGALAGLRAPRALLRAFFDRHGLISAHNVNNLVQLIQDRALKSRLHGKSVPFNGRLSLDGRHSIDWDDKPTIYEATSISHGHLLHFKQEWTSDGYSLGDLLYSLPLAPGQKKQVVVFDWDRKDSASNTQQLDYQDALYNSLSRDRDVNEIAKSTVKEKSFGGSLAGAGGRAGGGGIGGLVSGLLMGVSGIASGFGLGGSLAGQRSSRTATASSQQHVNDRTVQAAHSVRSQRSTVIQTVSQGERFEVSAESVANYNHCHAMTIQYFEVLRHFQVTTRLANVQECLFVPLELSPFDRKKAMRWREILAAALLKPELEAGFAATERIEDELASATENYYDSIGYPQNNYAEKTLNYLEGELFLEFQLERPLDKLDADGNWVYQEAMWNAFAGFIGLSTQEFFDRYIKNQQQKDENFFKYAGPTIAQRIIDSLGFYAVKNQAAVKLPIDATLLSTFRHRKKLNVSLRMSGPFAPSVKREDIDFIEIRIEGSGDRVEKINTLLNAGVRVIVHSGTMQYTTDIAGDYLFRNANISNDLTSGSDPVRIHTPPNANEMRSPRKEDALACNALLHHLNENTEYYHQAIWMQMDEQRRFMLLDGIIAPGKAMGRSVASVVENKLIGIVGNCLVLPVAPGVQLDPTLDESIDLYQHYYHDPLDPVRISLPTKGVFAEAVMGKCNSCEKKDETRFWRWEESPVPDSPTAINTISTPVPQNVQPNLQPKDFTAPIINLQNAPSIPDPQGYGGLLQLLNNPNIFRDLTGLSENQKNALAAFQASMTGAQGYAAMAKDLAMQQSNQKNSQATLDAIRNSPELSDEEKAALIKDHFRQLIDGGESKRAEASNKPTLSDVAARAEQKGKPVKATSSEPGGKTESVEIGTAPVAKKVLAEAKGTLLKLQQKNDKACWATAATIMLSWKLNMPQDVEEVLETADEIYLEKFNNGEGLSSSEKEDFITSLGMSGEPPASYPLEQYINWINTYGPLWITTDSSEAEGEFSPHARILFKIVGTDGNDTAAAEFYFIDPATGTVRPPESFDTFLAAYEQMVTDNGGDLFIQVVHFSDAIEEPTEGSGSAANIIYNNVPASDYKLIINTRELNAISGLFNWTKPGIWHNKSKRGIRMPAQVKLLVLHETASSVSGEANAEGHSGNNTSHMVVLRNGTVSQFNDLIQYEDHIKGGLSKPAIGLEFVNRSWLGGHSKEPKPKYAYGNEQIPPTRDQMDAEQLRRFPEGDDYMYCFWGSGFGIYRIPPDLNQLEKMVEVVKFFIVDLPLQLAAYNAGGQDREDAAEVFAGWLSIAKDQVDDSVIADLFEIENNWLQVVSYNEIETLWNFNDPNQVPADVDKGRKNLFVFTTGYGLLDGKKLVGKSGVFAHNAARGNHSDGSFVALYAWLRIEKNFSVSDSYRIAKTLMQHHFIKVTQKGPHGKAIVLLDVSDGTLASLMQ